MDQSRCIWQKLTDAGAFVPSNPAELEAAHLVLAAAAGVDVAAIIAATTPPRSARHLRTA